MRRSLYRLTSRRELREQIGDTATPFYTALQNLETACLLRLSEAARQHEQTQIALNAITAAQRLRSSLQFEVAQEFAHVLWLTKEPKYAVQHLRTVVAGIASGHDTSDQKLRNALLLTTLVGHYVIFIMNVGLTISSRVRGLRRRAWRNQRL